MDAIWLCSRISISSYDQVKPWLVLVITSNMKIETLLWRYKKNKLLYDDLTFNDLKNL